MEMDSAILFPQEEEDMFEFFNVEPDHASLFLTQWVLLDAQHDVVVVEDDDDDVDEHHESLSDDLTYTDVLGDQNHDNVLEFFGPFHVNEMEDKEGSYGIYDDDYDGGLYDDADDEEEDIDDGLDDELVPRGMRGKLVRERMRKLGKRYFSKMKSSKRSPYLYVKPGCVYGKHGLGIKHSI